MARTRGSAVPSQTPTFSSAFGEGTIVVEIGPEHKKYYVHKALLIQHSEYFRKALQGPWKEAQDGVVRLEDIDHLVFNLVVDWLYNTRLPTEVKDWQRVLESEYEEIWYQWGFATLVKAYAFGDRFQMEAFRRQVNNAFVATTSERYFWPSMRFESSAYAFNNIPPDRPILQLLVDEHCQVWDSDEDDEDLDIKALNELHPKFLLRAMRRLREMKEKSWDNLPMSTWCYYEHESYEQKKACTKYHMRYDERLDFGTFE